jgi:Zn-dependent protease
VDHLTPDTVVLGVTWFVVFLFSTTVHEASHAFASYRLGDPTAYHGGQVTLNPLPHIRREPIGMVVVPILTFVANGWMMGWASAPYDPNWERRYPRRSALMALAGPASNLALALLAGLGIRTGVLLGALAPPQTASFAHMTAAAPGSGAMAGAVAPLSILFSLNLLLFLFNLLPLPPLDGSGILPVLLPAAAAEAYNRIRATPALSLLGLLIAWQVFPTLYSPLETLALKLLYPGLHYT